MNHIIMNKEFKLIFATKNKGKYDEVKKMMPKKMPWLPEIKKVLVIWKLNN